MPILLYDLVGTDDRRFSPHCWRTRMALEHKGLEYQAIPTRFTEISGVCDGQQKTVPILQDGERIVCDSWAIAEYLEQEYPEQPSLFGGADGKILTVFIQNWTNATLHAGMIGMIVKDIHDHLLPEDQAYFRSSREKRFGKSLEELQSDRDSRLEGFRNSLLPLRMSVRDQAFIGGERPLYADYLAFSAFQWANTISDFPIELFKF